MLRQNMNSGHPDEPSTSLIQSRDIREVFITLTKLYPMPMVRVSSLIQSRTDHLRT